MPASSPTQSDFSKDRSRSTLRHALLRGMHVQDRKPFLRLSAGLFALLSVCALGSTSYRMQGWDWADSIYMVVITIFTVGYGEVRPVETAELRIITMVVIVFGYAATLLIISGLAQMVVDGELRKSLGIRRMITDIEKLDSHVIICGYGRMGHRLARRLKPRRDVIIVDHTEKKVKQAIDDGFLALRGSATEEDVLIAAGVHRADTLAAVTPDDATSLFVTITARGLNPNLKILARGEQPSTTQKLRQVGADHVVLAAAIGAERLSQLILRPTAAVMLRNDELPTGLIEDLETIGMTLDELHVEDQSALCGCRLTELTVTGKNSFLIVAVRNRDGEVIVNPATDTEVQVGDTIIVLGHEGDIDLLCDQFRLQRNEELVAEREAEPLTESVENETPTS